VVPEAVVSRKRRGIRMMRVVVVLVLREPFDSKYLILEGVVQGELLANMSSCV